MAVAAANGVPGKLSRPALQNIRLFPSGRCIRKTLEELPAALLPAALTLLSLTGSCRRRESRTTQTTKWRTCRNSSCGAILTAEALGGTRLHKGSGKGLSMPSRAHEKGRGKGARADHSQFVVANKKILSASSPDVLRELLESWAAEDKPLNNVNIATILYRVAKLQCSELYSSATLAYLSRSVNKPWIELDAWQVSNSLYGLQGLGVDAPPEALDLVGALAAKVESLQEELSAQGVSNSLYGLRSLTSESSEVRHLVAVLAARIEVSREKLSGQAIGTALYGLQGMSSQWQEVRLLVATLARKFSLSAVALDAQAVSNALYGLQGMSSGALEVTELLAALRQGIHESSEELSGQGVGNALYGLQGMDTASPEVRGLVQVLAEKVSTTNAKLDGQHVGNGIYGLRSMSSEASEVRHLLAALLPKVADANTQLRAQHVSQAFFGLQGMSSQHAEVRAMVSVLSSKAATCNETFSAQHVGNALYGLQGIGSDWPGAQDALAILLKKVQQSKDMLSSQEASNALYGMQLMDADLPEVRELVTALAEKAQEVNHSEGSSQVKPRISGHRRSRHPANPLVGKWAAPRTFSADFLDSVFPQGTGDRNYLVDVGCDMGSFPRSVAAARPDLNVLGLELRDHAVAFARQKAERLGLTNVAFVQGNANIDLAPLLRLIRERGEQALEVVTINFPDPHLQVTHRARRVVQGSLVALLADMLAKGREVLFQSDVPPLVKEVRDAFVVGGCFDIAPWTVSHELAPTERQLAIRSAGGRIEQVRLLRTSKAPPMDLAIQVDNVLVKLRGLQEES
eukprot:TRINITY_DN72628_c0_g1_i1.p1 TRINITY_DN72628_c0_g1~~TRINITY_DN72628_c0_g1_i1.p1  ORF type:complete len:801 (-),score=139.84 TRINITY_DN72628_c0_g1_i1:358-2760(-)